MKKSNNTSRFAGRAPVGKNKVVMAVVLLAIMGLMWVRLLTKKDPVSDAAAVQQAVIQQQQQQDEIKISPIQLQVVGGRNDVLSRDIFTTESWPDCPWKISQTAPGEADISDADAKEKIQEIANDISLDAIVIEQDQPPAAFMENKLVSVGSKLTIVRDRQSYEFIVTEISKKAVELKWKNIIVTTKMSQPAWSNQ